MNSNALTVGQVIRRIRAKEISPVYAVYGGEYYFEKYCKTLGVWYKLQYLIKCLI